MTEGEWLDANQRALTASLRRVRHALEFRLGRAKPEDAPPPAEPIDPPAALEVLVARFGLTSFERDVLLLCAGRELDSAFEELLAQYHPRGEPTFGMALAALPDAHWSALAPARPLRAWQLIEPPRGEPLTAAPLRIAERVLQFLTGIRYLDERCRALVTPVQPVPLSESQREAAERLARLLASDTSGAPPRVELTGNDGAAKLGIARAACDLLQIALYAAHAADLPSNANDRDELARLWQREAFLSGAVLLIDLDDATPEQRRSSTAFADRIGGLVFLRTRERQSGYRGAVVRIDVGKPPPHEQRELWRGALGAEGLALNGEVDLLATQFDLGAAAIASAALQVRGRRAAGEDAAPLAEQLWDSCRAEARPRLDDLAARIPPQAMWNDLVLPAQELHLLRELVGQTRKRAVVYEEWGFARRGARGLGISALFAGASGTGKTMAAEVLANELRLDLYAIDLSAVVSKYIGQTEENLRKVFDAAEEGGAVLLFDEADALFGKRTEVRDSHDRYANIEVSYLLQRMEAYRGVVILTTNFRSALDSAFLRRLRFIVNFPFPDAQQRAEIWRRIFPPETPLDGVDAEKLARLNVAGGHIRNIAVNAAFLAASAGEPVRMTHLLRAAQGECAKIERPLTDAETAGWA